MSGAGCVLGDGNATGCRAATFDWAAQGSWEKVYSAARGKVHPPFFGDATTRTGTVCAAFSRHQSRSVR